MLLCGFLYLVIRRAGLWAIVATVTTVLLCAFILVRAASLHDVDILLGRGTMGVTVNLVIEGGAIALDAIAALLAWRGLRQQRSTDRLSRRASPA